MSRRADRADAGARRRAPIDAADADGASARRSPRARASSDSGESSTRRAAIRASSTTTAGCRGAGAPRRDGADARRLSSPRSTPSWSAAPSVALGAGRDRVEDPVDPAVGIIVHGEAGRSSCRGGRSGARAALRRRSRLATRATPRWQLSSAERDAVDASADDAGRRRSATARRSVWRGARRCLAIGCNRLLRRGRHPRHRLRALDQPPRDQLAHGRLGPRPAVPLRAHRAARPAVGQQVFATLGDAITRLLAISPASGRAFVFGPLGDAPSGAGR